LVDVMEMIEHNNIKVLFVESETPSVYAETISSETDIELVTGLWVETLKENQSYKDFVISNVELIVENLDHDDHSEDHDDHEHEHEHEHEGEK